MTENNQEFLNIVNKRIEHLINTNLTGIAFLSAEEIAKKHESIFNMLIKYLEKHKEYNQCQPRYGKTEIDNLIIHAIFDYI